MEGKTASPTATMTTDDLFRPECREERLRRLSPERLALYHQIRKLREEIGPVPFDIVAAIRELREND